MVVCISKSILPTSGLFAWLALIILFNKTVSPKVDQNNRFVFCLFVFLNFYFKCKFWQHSFRFKLYSACWTLLGGSNSCIMYFMVRILHTGMLLAKWCIKSTVTLAFLGASVKVTQNTGCHCGNHCIHVLLDAGLLHEGLP